MPLYLSLSDARRRSAESAAMACKSIASPEIDLLSVRSLGVALTDKD
jgi:hypothetical protein